VLQRIVEGLQVEREEARRIPSMTVRSLTPFTGCGSNNNDEGGKTACKEVTGENPCRQPVCLDEGHYS
jgi:hypothetical protein